MADTVYYTNQEGKLEKDINPQNFSDFKKFVKATSEENKKNLKRQSNISPITISDDVKLEDFFDKEMTPENRECMEYFLSSSLAVNCSPSLCEQLLNMSEHNPKFVYQVFQYAGNLHYSSYPVLINGLQKRPMLNNLRLYDYANQEKNLFWKLEGTQEPVEHLTKTQKEILSRWAYANSSSTIAIYNNNLLTSGILLNCDNLPAEWRKKVNDEAIISRAPETTWMNLESRHMDKDFLKSLFKDNSINRQQPIMPKEGAKTQEEKNVGILPQYYKNLKEALISAANNMPNYNSSNFGKELSLNQRYQNLLKEIMGSTFDVEQTPQSLLYEVNLETAQKDIVEGRSQDLSKNVLENVLKEDQNNYYIRKIPSQILTDKKVNLDFIKNNFVDLQNLKDYQLSELEEKGRKTFNRQEKDKLAQFLSEKKEKTEQQLQASLEILKEKQKDEQKLRQLNQERSSTETCSDTIYTIQDFYNQIKQNFKNGTPNSQEAEILSEDKIENIIAQAIQGQNVCINIPEQKSLPLLIGRKEEQQRREQLNASIGKMNRFLNEISELQNEDIQSYAGKILSKESLTKARDKNEEKQNIYKDEFYNFSNKWYANTVEKDIKQAEEHLASIHQTKDKIINRKKAIEKLAKDNVSVQEEKLEDVSKLKGEEKHKARAANKTRGKDKLAEKAKAAKKDQDLKLLRAKKLQEIQH